MAKVFNVTGSCDPELHYMVDITERLVEIKKLVDKGAYFTINRARQYGKTTTLDALSKYLVQEYVVVYLDFQVFSNSIFENEVEFVREFANEIYEENEIPSAIGEQLINSSNLRVLFKNLSDWCAVSDKPIVLIIDEVDSATNNQVFIDFLAQLRSYYLKRNRKPTFKSVILAGVYDVKNIKRKIRQDDDSKVNSPWNIAVDFKIDMSLAKTDIAKMLEEYKTDKNVDMDANKVANLIYDYTSGYPFLVSRICQIQDEEIDVSYAWTQKGILEAVNMILMEKNTLFESLMGKLTDYPELQNILYTILFGGERIVYNPDNSAIDIATMFGFVKNINGSVTIANRIFEVRIYNYFLTTTDSQNSEIFRKASNNKSQFIKDNGRLNMDLVMEKYVEYFDDIYGDNAEIFDEEEGRRRFLLFIRPIINGTGNYYIESETRNARRMDIVVDYQGERFVIELKIWRGNAYNTRGEQQLADYLDYFKLEQGYMLSYNFNKNKSIGVSKISLGNKLLIEAVV